MSTVEQIDLICEQIGSKPLSSILPQVLPISLECNDYEGYFILSKWNTPLSKEPASN